jgi:hypothetical protein
MKYGGVSADSVEVVPETVLEATDIYCQHLEEYLGVDVLMHQQWTENRLADLSLYFGHSLGFLLRMLLINSFIK